MILLGWVFLMSELPLYMRDGAQDKKMSEGHLPRVVYHQVYNVYLGKWGVGHLALRRREEPLPHHHRHLPHPHRITHPEGTPSLPFTPVDPTVGFQGCAVSYKKTCR